jgi:protein gp37
MADGSRISWTDATWNPITGCSVISPGCTNCYAMKAAGTRLRAHPSRAGLTIPTKAGPVWNGQVRLNEDWLTQPLRWRRPRKIFVCAHGDLFHESVPDEWIDRVFAVMSLSPQHTYQVLTKRSARMRQYMDRLSKGWVLRLSRAINEIGGAAIRAANAPGRPAPKWPLPNVWLGVSAEDQARADERVGELLATPAAVRFLSAEPLLGAMDLTRLGRGLDHGKEVAGCGLTGRRLVGMPALEPVAHDLPWHDRGLDWVIVGEESGPGRRELDWDHVRRLRDDCALAGTAFFFKQGFVDGRKVELPQLDGVVHDAFPDFREAA